MGQLAQIGFQGVADGHDGRATGAGGAAGVAVEDLGQGLAVGSQPPGEFRFEHVGQQIGVPALQLAAAAGPGVHGIQGGPDGGWVCALSSAHRRQHARERDARQENP